ncbi:MAG: hypothetical protein ACRC0C_22505 [Gibbsiella quercinecans]|uniref:hypothetical protein n=1 Tax=Gibbsiella quercinecans TaxID=929813 RepID=UPI003F305462
MLVTLNCPLQSSALSVKKLKEVIEDNLDILVPALTSGLSFYSESARYVPNSLEILEIKPLHNNEYSMHYRYQWEIFNGCLDISAEENISDNVTFTLNDGKLLFDIIDRSRPSTLDEL